MKWWVLAGIYLRAYSYYRSRLFGMFICSDPGRHILNARGHLMMLEMDWRFYTGLRQHDREERH